MPTETESQIYLDAHVHVYPGYDLGIMLKGLCARAARHVDAYPAVILLETASDPVFRRWREGEGRFAAFQPVWIASDGRAFDVATSVGRVRLYAGRQIVCAGRLEVIAVGCLHHLSDGMSPADAVTLVTSHNAVAVLPWGVGKWMGRRSLTVAALLRTFPPKALLLGDSALRPIGWPTPKPMRDARGIGRGVLAGTDPLPGRTVEAGEVGRYASVLPYRGEDVPDAGALIRILRDDPSPWRVAGRRCGPISFMQRQIAAMRNARRHRESAARA